MRSTSIVLSALAMASLLCACASPRAAGPTAPQSPEPGAGIPPGEALPPGQPVPPEQPSRPSQRQFHPGPAATPRVTQAPAPATPGDYRPAPATPERACCVWAENPSLV